MRGCGRTGRPAFPAPSLGRKVHIKTRADAARTRSRVWNLSSSCCEWSEAMDGCASVGSKLDCFAALAMTGLLDREWSEAMDGCALVVSKLDCFAVLAMTGPLDGECSEAMDGCASVGSKLDCFAALAMTGPRAISDSGSAPERFSDRLLTSARGVGLQ